MDVRSNLESVKLICNLSAPLAVKLLEPVELSKSVESSLEVTNFSDTVNPTLVLGSTEYGSRIRVCSLHCTKCPLI